MPEKSGVERRRHPRAPRKFLIKFRVIGGPVSRDIADRVGQVYNVSKGGILLVSKRPLPPGTVLDLKFPDNVFAGEAKTFQGMVRRLDPETKEGDHPLGLAFVRIATPEKEPSVEASKPSAGGAERRQSQRTSQKLLVKLMCVSAASFEDSLPRGASLLNISEGGMEILTDRDYARGTALSVHLPQNPLGPARTLLATVMWSRPGEKPGSYRVGTSIAKGPPPPLAKR